MGNFTSTSKKAKKPAPHPAAQITDSDKVVLSLKTQRNKLNGEQKLLEARIDRHQEVARQLLSEGRRDRALMALKKKKMTEKQLEHLSTHILNLEGMLNNIEGMKQQAKLFEVLQKGNDELKALQKLVAIDDVKQLLEDTAEAKAYQDELNTLLGQSLSDVDNEAVEAEMEALEEEALREEVGALPAAPTLTPAEKQAYEERQRAEAAKQEAARAQAQERVEAKEEGRREAPLLAG